MCGREMKDHEELPKEVAKWIINYLLAELNQVGIAIEDSPVRPTHLLEIILMVRSGYISELSGKKVLRIMMDNGVKQRKLNIKIKKSTALIGAVGHA